MRSSIFVLAPLVVASCTHDVAVFDRVSVRPARALDLLYVLDDSADRGTYDVMASQLGVLTARLADVDGQLPDLHVGVVTTDLGTRGARDPLAPPPVGRCAGDGNAGRLVSLQGGSLVPTGGFLEDLRGPGGTRVRSFDSEDLALEIARLTNPGPGTASAGCEFEQPLEAMRRALDPSVNPDFVRPGAMLSVVFLTTEDDCSFARGALLDPADESLGPLSSFRCTEQGVICDGDGDPAAAGGGDPRRAGARTSCRPREGSPLMVDVSEYRTFLEELKPDPRDVVVSAVAGARDPFEVRDLGVPTLAPSCQGPGGLARPAVRLGAIVDAFGGALVDGCTQEAAYEQITAPIVNRQRSCFPNLRRTDGDDCTVTEIAGGARTELARCVEGGGPTPCWYTFTDEAACPAGDNVGIAIRRGDATAPPGARVEATCFLKE